MEKTTPEPSKLKEAEAIFLRKYDTFRNQATNLIDLTKHYKELQARFVSAENDLRRRFREVKEREDQIEVKEKEAEEKCKSNLLSLKSFITEHVYELDVLSVRLREKREECEAVENRVSVAKEELRWVERAVVDRREEFEGVNREFELKRGELSEVEKSMAKCAKEVELREGRIREMDSRAKEFGKLMEELMEEWCCRVEMKEREVEGMCVRFGLRGEMFESRVEEIGDIEKRVEECLNVVVLRERKLDEVEKLIGERENCVDFHVRQFEERVKEFELFASRRRTEHLEKEEHLALVEKSMKERETKLDALEKLIQERGKSVDLASCEVKMKEEQLEEQAKEFDLKQIAFASKVTEQLEREKHFTLLEKSIQEREQTLESLEKLFQESKEHSERQLEVQGRELQSKQNLLTSQQLEREVQLASLEKSLQECEKKLNAFQMSVQEQKEQVDLLSHRLQTEERELLKQGKELELKLKHHESQVKAEQLKLTPTANHMIAPFCRSDQSNISTDGRSSQLSVDERLNNIEMVGGELTPLLDADEISRLLGMISQHKQTLQLCLTLGIEDKMPDILWNLIERKQLIEAVRFIYTFKLNDEFPPFPLLRDFVEDARKCCAEVFSKDIPHDEKEKVVDDQIADLRAVLECIEEFGLESQYPSIDLIMHIEGLQILKENRKLAMSLPPYVKIQEQRKRRKQSLSSTPSSTYQLRKRT